MFIAFQWWHVSCTLFRFIMAGMCFGEVKHIFNGAHNSRYKWDRESYRWSKRVNRVPVVRAQFAWIECNSQPDLGYQLCKVQSLFCWTILQSNCPTWIYVWAHLKYLQKPRTFSVANSCNRKMKEMHAEWFRNDAKTESGTSKLLVDACFGGQFNAKKQTTRTHRATIPKSYDNVFFSCRFLAFLFIVSSIHACQTNNSFHLTHVTATAENRAWQRSIVTGEASNASILTFDTFQNTLQFR